MRAATRSIKDTSRWLENQRDLEGSFAGAQAAMDLATSLSSTGNMAGELSEAATSNPTRELYDAIELSFEQAALAIASRGGSFGAGEMALVQTAMNSAMKLTDHCPEG